jgi:hypothetical protein
MSFPMEYPTILPEDVTTRMSSGSGTFQVLSLRIRTSPLCGTT